MYLMRALGRQEFLETLENIGRPIASSHFAPRVGVSKEFRLSMIRSEIPTSSESNDTIMTEIETETESSLSFADLGLSPATLIALEKIGYKTPSPIQAELIPPALEGRDCLGNAPTGTGKTAAFLVPILEKIDEKDRRPQVLILAPTRELVHQIGAEFDKLSRGRLTRAA